MVARLGRGAMLLFTAAVAANAQTTAPEVDAGGIVNAADYTTAIAPGMIISVFGNALAPKVTSAASTPLPTVLDGTSVEVNGQPIPLFFVSPSQINAQMPFAVSSQVQVRVRTAAGLSAPATVTVSVTAPRLFTKTMDGKGEPLLLHNADWSLVSAAFPARPGEHLILYLTGLGAVSPVIPAGQAGGDNDKNGPLNQLPSGVVTVTLGGKPAPILFAGLAPGWVGLYQINFQAPADLPGGAAALVASTEDGPSQAGVTAAAASPVALTADLGGGVKMDFAQINPGEFMMGCSPGDSECWDGEKPQHPVRITKAFQMGKFEVTQEQWQAINGSNPSRFNGTDLPVEQVSWNDIQTFLQKMNARNDGFRYRLPTEAEWEYAARAGTADKYAGGVLDEIAWHLDNGGNRTHPVGKKKPNAWGLYDMLGNVWEWVQDWHGSYSSSLAVDPDGPSTGTSKIFRGASWDNSSRFTRVSFRYNSSPGGTNYGIGFRCVRE